MDNHSETPADASGVTTSNFRLVPVFVILVALLTFVAIVITNQVNNKQVKQTHLGLSDNMYGEALAVKGPATVGLSDDQRVCVVTLSVPVVKILTEDPSAASQDLQKLRENYQNSKALHWIWEGSAAALKSALSTGLQSSAESSIQDYCKRF